MNARPEIPNPTAPLIEAKLDAGQIKRLLPVLNRVATPRSSIPVLSRVRVTLDQGTVAITATDLDNELTVQIDADADGSGSVLIDPKPLGPLARAADGSLRLSMPEPEVVEVAGGHVTLRLGSYIHPADFPQFPEKGDFGRNGELSQDALLRLITLSRDFASTEETRYYLNGIFLCPHPERGTLRAVTTDGHRLAVIDSDEWLDLPGSGAIVPRKTVDILRRMLTKGGNEPVTVRASRTQIIFATPDWTLRAKLIDGTYQDYTRVLPARSDNLRAHISARTIQTLVAAHIAAGERERGVELDAKRDAIVMRGFDGAATTAPALIHRDDAAGTGPWGFNAVFLSDLSRVLGDLHLTADRPDSPATLRSEDHPDALWVLMPMRI